MGARYQPTVQCHRSRRHIQARPPLQTTPARTRSPTTVRAISSAFIGSRAAMGPFGFHRTTTPALRRPPLPPPPSTGLRRSPTVMISSWRPVACLRRGVISIGVRTTLRFWYGAIRRPPTAALSRSPPPSSMRSEAARLHIRITARVPPVSTSWFLGATSVYLATSTGSTLLALSWHIMANRRRRLGWQRQPDREFLDAHHCPAGKQRLDRPDPNEPYLLHGRHDPAGTSPLVIQGVFNPGTTPSQPTVPQTATGDPQIAECHACRRPRRTRSIGIMA